MNRIVIRPSRREAILVTLCGLGFVAGGVFILLQGDSALVAWSTMLFFGACALTGLWQLSKSQARLIIDSVGIFDRTLGIGKIAWSEIVSAYMAQISENDFICLILRDPDKFLRRLSPMKRWVSGANRALGFTEFNINLCGLSVRTEEVFELILKKLALERVRPTKMLDRADIVGQTLTAILSQDQSSDSFNYEDCIFVLASGLMFRLPGFPDEPLSAIDAPSQAVSIQHEALSQVYGAQVVALLCPKDATAFEPGSALLGLGTRKWLIHLPGGPHGVGACGVQVLDDNEVDVTQLVDYWER